MTPLYILSCLLARAEGNVLAIAHLGELVPTSLFVSRLLVASEQGIQHTALQ